jgi:hypothetical protein
VNVPNLLLNLITIQVTFHLQLGMGERKARAIIFTGARNAMNDEVKFLPRISWLFTLLTH